MISKVFDKFGIKSERTKNISKHVSLSFLFKGGSIVASFLLIPLTLGYLDQENYGIWLTISSFIAWFSFFDIGIGNGLRNKFVEAKESGQQELAKSYVSTAYFSLTFISIILILIFFVSNIFIDWTKVFNTSADLQRVLTILMPIVFCTFFIRLVLRLITTIYAADQNHSMPGKVDFIIQAGSLIMIWIITRTSEGSLLIFGSFFSILPLLVLLGLNLYSFSGIYKNYKPALSYFDRKFLNNIFGLGIYFFIIQLGWIVITSTDNLIISKLFSPEEVVPYNISFKLFGLTNMLFVIIVTPYWSSFTEAYYNKDYQWIKNSMKSLRKFVFLFWIICLIILLCSNFLYDIWLGESVEVPFELSSLMFVYTSIIIYLTPLNYFLNGTGKIRIQLILTVVFALLNIPISIFLARNLGLGVNGVLIGTIVSIIPGAIFSTLQTNFIINQKEVNKIWYQ